MKTAVFFFSSFFLLATCQTKPKQEEWVTAQTKLPDHPRLILLKGEEDALKTSIEADSTWRAVSDMIIGRCNEILNAPPSERKMEGRRLLTISRESRRRIYYLSFAWRLTKERKYLERAEVELLKISSFQDWNPSHFLDVAEMTMAAAIGYDWLYDDLPKSSLNIIKEAIVKKGLEPSFVSKDTEWLENTGNWNQVCNAGMTFGALAIYEDYPELARQIINRSIGSIPIGMGEYEPDGAFPEGYMYWGYGTTFNIYFINALEKAFGTDFGLMEKNPGFSKTAGYLTNMVGPTGQSFNYSDSHSNGQLNTGMFWYASRLKDSSLLFSEKMLLKTVYPQGDLPSLLIWGAHLNMKKIDPPKELIWVGQGRNPVAMMRTAWKRDAIFVGLKGGSARNGHAHMDVGTFVMDALGERWAMDFGHQDYDFDKGIDGGSMKQNSSRWLMLRNSNKGHNTLTFDSNLQRGDGFAPITKSTKARSFLSATVNLTAAYDAQATKVQRGVALVNGEYVTVRDEIELSDKAATIRWNLLTGATVKIIDGRTAELSQNGKKIMIMVEQPENIKLVTWSTDPPHEYDQPNPGTTFIGFETRLPANAAATFTVHMIPSKPNKTSIQKTKPLSEW